MEIANAAGSVVPLLILKTQANSITLFTHIFLVASPAYPTASHPLVALLATFVGLSERT